MTPGENEAEKKSPIKITHGPGAPGRRKEMMSISVPLAGAFLPTFYLLASCHLARLPGERKRRAGDNHALRCGASTLAASARSTAEMSRQRRSSLCRWPTCHGHPSAKLGRRAWRVRVPCVLMALAALSALACSLMKLAGGRGRSSSSADDEVSAEICCGVRKYSGQL